MEINNKEERIKFQFLGLKFESKNPSFKTIILLFILMITLWLFTVQWLN